MMNLPSTAPVEKKYSEEPVESAASKAFAGSANFTKKLAVFEATPFLLMGLSSLAITSSHDIAQVARGMGGLMVAASPFILVLKCLALPVLAGSSIATAATGIAYGTEKLVNKVKEPSEADKQRIEHTRHFVLRMKDFIAKSPDEQRSQAEQNPGSVISLSLFTVVFLSRKLDGDQIKDGDAIIKQADVANMDAHAREYFSRVCKLKSYLTDLKLSPDDSHAWTYLSHSIKNFYEHPEALQEFEKATLEKMIKECDALTALIVQDEIFQAAWKGA